MTQRYCRRRILRPNSKREGIVAVEKSFKCELVSRSLPISQDNHLTS